MSYLFLPVHDFRHRLVTHSFPPLALFAWVCLAVVCFSRSLLWGADNLTLYTDSQGKAIPVVMVEGHRYVPLMDFLSVLGPVTVAEKSTLALQIRLNKNTLFFRPNSSLVVVNGVLTSLEEPVLVMAKTWLVPAEFIAKVTPRLTDRKVIFRPNSSQVFLSSVPVPQVFFDASKGMISSKVAIEVSQPVPFEMKREGKIVTVTLGNRPLDSKTERLSYSDDLINSVSFDISDLKPTIRITLNTASVEVKSLPASEGRVFVVSISKIQLALIPPTSRAGAAQPSTTEGSASALPLVSRGFLHTVSIDVGHGGTDAGARSANNAVLEKNVTLEIAQRLRYALQRRMGIQVNLTREADVGVSLDQRALTANTSHSDVFVSIHAGFSLAKQWTGFRVYVFYPGSAAPGGASLPTDAPNRSTVSHEVSFRNWAFANAPNFQMNMTLAEMVQSELALLWKSEAGGGPHPAMLRPLANVVMPAVLIELGNLNAEADAQQLKNPQFQASIANAISNAIERFKPTYESQKRDETAP